MALAPRTRILVAVNVEERIERSLSGHDLALVKTSNQARALLEAEEFGLVILGVHFDESQMFSLLDDIRAHARYRKVPILCVMGERGRILTDVAIKGLDHAVKAMLANGFLNLERFADDAEGDARLRRIVDSLILLDGELQQISGAAGRPTLTALSGN